MATDAWGIDDGWVDTQGQWRPASPATVDAIRTVIGEPRSGRPVWIVRPGTAEVLNSRCHLTLGDATEVGEIQRLPSDLPLGLHQLAPLDGGPRTTVLVSPGRCHLPDSRRSWGVVAQVPTTRSRRSWGIGDLADIRTLAEWLHGLGGGFLAISPLHSSAPVSPISRSPYFPSSRRWRSPLLIRVDEVNGGDAPAVAALGARARALLANPVVDRDACWALQRLALEVIWEDLPSTRRDALARWRAGQGDGLEGWARFCALAERHGGDWRSWPAELRHPERAAVVRAAAEFADRVSFHAWLQLLVAEQLDAARQEGLGLVQDLAVGVDPGGADAWLWQDRLATEFSVGAPPDDFAPEGQQWGLPPWIPARLRDVGYRPLADLLRTSLLPGGGLRIDHAMGLKRLFWIPAGAPPSEGTYVRFEGRDLLELVAMESARAGAIVVGEDLGTVEPGFREDLTAAGILSTRVLWFEDDPPESWPRQALALVTTHDLPTLAGMCSGADRPAAMWRSIDRLVAESATRPYSEVSAAVHGHLGDSPAVWAAATLEDLVGVLDRPNRPGTGDDDHPNWSVALPLPLEDLVEDPGVRQSLDSLASGRRD